MVDNHRTQDPMDSLRGVLCFLELRIVESKETSVIVTDEQTSRRIDNFSFRRSYRSRFLRCIAPIYSGAVFALVLGKTIESMLRKTIFTACAIATISVAAMAIGLPWQSSENKSGNSDIDPHRNSAAHQQRVEQRQARMAAYERQIDSLITSRNYRFIPETMQQLPAGVMRNLNSALYEVTVMPDAVDVFIPFLKGYVPPYYPVVFNYVVPSVSNYHAEKSSNGWQISFQTTLFSATNYTFLFEVSPHYGNVVLTISSPFYNSVQYMGNMVGI